MIKYYVQAYDRYYPEGGIDDLVGPFDALDDALQHYNAVWKSYSFVWIIRIVDSVIDREWTYPSPLL